MNSTNRRGLLSRRSLLRGAGVTLALPWLEAMSPLRSFAKAGSAAPGQIPTRLGFLHYNLGMQRLSYFPAATGPDCELSRILKPLEKSRGEFTVFSNICTHYDLGGHSREVSFLTGINPKRKGGFQNSISYDQIAAEHLGQGTRFPSLVMGQRRGTGFGSNLVHTLSWSRAGVPIPAESRPQVLFTKLFRQESAEGRAQRLADEARGRSVLDAVRDDARRMSDVLGKADREKLSEYLASVRDVEQRIDRVNAWADKPPPAVDGSAYDALGSRPLELDDAVRGQAPFQQYSRLMFDLIALAWQTDSTRIVSYAARRDVVPAELGSPISALHTLTHDGGDPVKLEWWARTDEFYMAEFQYFLDKLKSIREGDGTLLDHALVGYSSEINGTHSREQLPTLLAGGRAAGIRHQTHVKCPELTLVGNLWESMLVKAGVPLTGHLANSSGLLPAVV